MEKNHTGLFKLKPYTEQDKLLILKRMREVLMKHPDLYQEILSRNISLEKLSYLVFSHPNEAHFIDLLGNHTAYRLNNPYTLNDDFDDYERHIEAIHDYMKEQKIPVATNKSGDFLNINADKINLMKQNHFVLIKWFSLENMNLYYSMNRLEPLPIQKLQVEKLLNHEQIQLDEFYDKNELEILYTKKIYFKRKGK